MAHKPIGARTRARDSLRTLPGLPVSALAVMVGIVLVINVHVYGALGAVAGVILSAAGIALGIHSFGIHSFGAASTAADPPAADGCPESGEDQT